MNERTRSAAGTRGAFPSRAGPCRGADLRLRSPRRARSARPGIAAALLLAAVAADAVCGNLIVNGDFAASHDGWQPSGTCQVFDDDAVGSPVRGSLGMNCLGAGAPSGIASQCVNIATGPVDFSARWSRNTSLPPADTVGIGFEAFADGQCAGASLGILAAPWTIDVPGVSCCGEPWH